MSFNLHDISIIAMQEPVGCDQATAFDVSRDQMPWRYCRAEPVQCSLDGEVIVVENPRYRGCGLPILAREARPFVPDMGACSRFQTREVGRLNPNAIQLSFCGRRRNDQPQLLLKQERAAIRDRGVRRQNRNLYVDLSVRWPIVGCEAHVIARIFRGEIVKARNQPTHGESAETCDIQNAVIALRYDTKGALNLVKRSGQREAEHTAFLRKFRAISSTLEKRRTDECLKMADMATDRPMCDGKFLGGSREPAMTRGGFKRAQRCDRQVFAILNVRNSHIDSAKMSIYSVNLS